MNRKYVYTVTLRKPYWGAHKTFGWTEKEMGFGVNYVILGATIGNEGTLEVKLDCPPGGVWHADWQTLEEHIHTRRDVFVARGVRIYVLPRSLFVRAPDRVEEETWDFVKETPEPLEIETEPEKKHQITFL